MKGRVFVLGSIAVFGLAWLVLFVLALRVDEQTQIEEVVSATSNAYSVDEVAKHRTPDDCWIIVRGNVYDVSAYIDKHPAARRTITDYCGKESTTAFETKERGRNHSASAWELLETYRLSTRPLGTQ